MRRTPRVFLNASTLALSRTPNRLHINTRTTFRASHDMPTTRADQFTKSALSADQLLPEPLAQFHKWYASAAEHVPLHYACTLSTAALPSGRVSARMVYLKDIEERTPTLPDGGFVVYTNLGTSRKAGDLQGNAHAALTFWWREQERQVRIEGATQRLSTAESQAYFDSRARGSRIGAWASPQSRVLSGREELDGLVADTERKFEGMGNDVEDGKGDKEKIPCPDFWGGLRVVPDMVEFWQGRESRLHDRFRYTREGDKWTVERLSP